MKLTTQFATRARSTEDGSRRAEIGSQRLAAGGGRLSAGVPALHRNSPISDSRPLTSAFRLPRTAQPAFSLLEVMIAMAIFFVAIFAILELTTQSLSAARHLQTSHVDVTGVAATLSLTNRLEEGPLPPEIADQFEDLNPGYRCVGNIYEVSSNGLFRVDFEVAGIKGKKVVGSSMSILLFRPESASSFRNKLGR